MRTVALIVGVVLSVSVLAGCLGNGEPATKTDPVTHEAQPTRKQLGRFAYDQTKAQARKTCRFVPRRVLARSFARASRDRPRAQRYNDASVALLYAEDVGIRPIRLQQAAYDGCLEGLRDARRR